MSFVPPPTIIRLLSALLLAFPWASGAVAQEKPDLTEALNVAKVSAPLTNEERTLAVKLAEQALKENKLFTDKKMFLTDARMSRDTASERKGVFERLAVLTYYRYEGDLPIEVFMNLSRKAVLAVKKLPNLVPPISREEFALAKQLALNHPQLKEALGRQRDRLEVEALTTRHGAPKDPLVRHRIVYLLFRVGPNYLMRQSNIYVDLTAEKVIIEPAPQPKPM